MRLRRHTGNTLKPHCDPNSISMNGVGAKCRAFWEMGIESRNHSRGTGPHTSGYKEFLNSGRGGATKLKVDLPDRAVEARNGRRSWREPAPSEQQ